MQEPVKMTAEQLFAEKSDNFKKQFVMDKSIANARKLYKFVYLSFNSFLAANKYVAS